MGQMTLLSKQETGERELLISEYRVCSSETGGLALAKARPLFSGPYLMFRRGLFDFILVVFGATFHSRIKENASLETRTGT